MYRGNMGGFGGNNMANLMRQAQKMQEELAKKSQIANEELNNTTLKASVSGGMVEVEILGNKKIQSIKINPEVLSDDVEMLEDMLVACVNEAISKADELEKNLKGDMPTGF